MKNVKQILAQTAIPIVVLIIGFIIFDKKNSENFVALEKKLNLNENPVQTGISFDLNTFQDSLVKNSENAKKSVVSILANKDISFYFENPVDLGPGNLVEQKTEIWGGSAIIISKDGYLITSKHVISDEKASYTVIMEDRTKYEVDKIWFDPTLDLAVLKIVDEKGNIPVDLKSAKFISISDTIKIGQFVLAIGNALNEYHNSVSLGILSAKNRNPVQQNGNKYIGFYQTDASINAGNSGGPLLDINGEVIGLTTAINEFAKGIGFGLPVNQEFVDNTLNSIQKNGKIIRPEIGFEYVDITSDSKTGLKLDLDTGIYVKNIFSGSSVQLAGLLPGDIIIKINENEITSELPFLFQYYSLKAGEKANYTVIRNGDKKSITVGTTPNISGQAD